MSIGDFKSKHEWYINFIQRFNIPVNVFILPLTRYCTDKLFKLQSLINKSFLTTLPYLKQYLFFITYHYQ